MRLPACGRVDGASATKTVDVGSIPSRAQSCKSGRAFRVGFGPGLGLKLTKISGLIRAWDVLFVLGVQKNNQNNLAISLNFLDLTQFSVFFRHDLGFKLIFGFGPGSGL